MGVEGVLVARGDVPAQHALLLVLGQLIEAVRHLEPIPRGEQIEMEDVFGTGLPVEAVKDRFIISDVMDRQVFGRIEKMTRAHSVDHDKIPDLGSAEAERNAASPGSKGSPVAIDLAERFGGSEPRSR